MNSWKIFVNKEGSPPGKIDNSDLLKKIVRGRRDAHDPEYDDNIGVEDKKDYYSLSI